MTLLDQLSFPVQISRPVSRLVVEHELPRALLNFNSLEVLRRAFVAAIKSIDIAAGISPAPDSSVRTTCVSGWVEVATGPTRQTGKTYPPAHAGGSDKTSLANFIDEVRRAIGSQSVVSSAADARGLRVLEATDVRGLRFRAVFIAGLVEGGFPLRASRDWIYPHEERERLKKYGLTLEDISPATLLKEEHYFYQAACRATERLYLSRPARPRG